MHDFRKLQVWERSRVLAATIYRLCARVTQPEKKLITAQLRRSALSISSNIAEGCGKGSRAEMVRYLEIACGSAAETDHHLQLAADLGIFPARECAKLSDEAVQLRRMLRALIERMPEARKGR